MILQKASVTKALYETGAFAVVRVPTVERGCEIAEGLIRGGVHAMEISYTLPNAGEVIAGIKEKFGDQMIGDLAAPAWPSCPAPSSSWPT